MKRTIYLHIGIHKTGTTSIQHFLSNEFDFLKQNGVLYSKRLRKLANGKVINAHHDLSWMFGSRASKVRLLETNSGKLNNILLKELDVNRCRIALLSSEAFSYSSVKALSDFKSVFPSFNFKVIVYIRRQDKYIESEYKQRIKTGSVIELKSLITPRVYDYNLLLGKVEKVFGRKNILLNIFDDKDVKANLTKHFLKNLEIEAEVSSPLSKNTAFSNHDIDLIKQLNHISDRKYVNQVFKYFIKQSRFKGQSSLDNSTFMSKEEFKSIYEKSINSNRIVLTNYNHLLKREELFNWNYEEDLGKIKEYNSKIHSNEKLQTLLEKIIQESYE